MSEVTNKTENDDVIFESAFSENETEKESAEELPMEEMVMDAVLKVVDEIETIVLRTEFIKMAPNFIEIEEFTGDDGKPAQRSRYKKDAHQGFFKSVNANFDQMVGIGK